MTLNLRTLGLFLVTSLSATQAFSVPIFANWYVGKWSCTVDGRPATMEWTKQIVPVVCVKAPCPPDTVTYTTGVFTEQGEHAERLKVVSETKFDLEFSHGNDAEPWYLAYDASLKAAVGHSTVDGQRHLLTCRKAFGPIPLPGPVLEPEPVPAPVPGAEEM